jgi:hypothetical protein
LGNVASIRAKRSQYNISQYQLASSQSEVAAEVTAATMRGQRQALDSAQRAVQPLSPGASDINYLELGPDGQAILAFSRDKTVQFSDVATGKPP